MEYREHFEEIYTIGLLENYGATYRQMELLYQGKKGSFYQCTITLHDYIYQAISYITKNNVRLIYRLLSVNTLCGEPVPCKDVFFHMERNLNSQRDRLSLQELRFGLEYSVVCLFSGLLFVASFLMFVFGVFICPLVFSFLKSIGCIGVSILLFVARHFLVRFRHIWFSGN